MSFTTKIKVAFVHDDFIQNGGAEKLFLEIVNDFSRDPGFEIKVYSSLISPSWKGIFAKNRIAYEESFLAKIPFSYKIYKFFTFLNLYSIAFQSFDFSEFNTVFSSSTRFGHCITTKPSTYHISYINSPFRAIWEEREYFYGKKFLYTIFKNFLPSLRIYDFYSQNFSNLIISNSRNIKNKVSKMYKRNSIILYPFLINQELKNVCPKENYYLIISRLVSWKRLDYVIEEFKNSGKTLVIVGDGPELKRYQKLISNNIKLKGLVSEREKIDLLSKAKALIVPQNEDFGLVILEAIYSYCPIIYFDYGGAKEILNSKLGIPFYHQDSESLNQALSKMDTHIFKNEDFEQSWKKFSKSTFISFLKKLIKIRFNKIANLV